MGSGQSSTDNTHPEHLEEEPKDSGEEKEEEEKKPLSLDEQLLYWVQQGDEEKIRELHKAGGDVNATQSPVSALGSEAEKKLDWISTKVYDEVTGDAALHLAAEKNLTKIVSLLFYLGANMEQRNRVGSTPLLRAVSHNNHETIVELLKLRADVHTTNRIGNNAMHIACNLGDVSLIRLLMEHDVAKDLKVRNKVSMTPIEYTQKLSPARNLLLETDPSLSEFLEDEPLLDDEAESKQEELERKE